MIVLRKKRRRLHDHSNPTQIACKARCNRQESLIGATPRPSRRIIASLPFRVRCITAHERPRGIAHYGVERVGCNLCWQFIVNRIRLKERCPDQMIKLEIANGSHWLSVELEGGQVETEGGNPQSGSVDVDTEQLLVQNSPNQFAARSLTLGVSPDETPKRLHEEGA
jgi:hypothetical protein